MTRPPLWRSLDDGDLQSLLDAEFPAAAAIDGIDRRALLRLMGASLALAGVAARGDSAPERPLTSQARLTPGHAAGVPLQFATALEMGGYGRGALVTSHDGRPIRIDGNPLHAASGGAADLLMQAEILALYDPDRVRAPTERGRPRRWDETRAAFAAARADMAARGGEGVHILAAPSASPTLAGLRVDLAAALPTARWHNHDPIDERSATAGAAFAFGRQVDTLRDLAAADTIVSLGSDPLGPGPDQLVHAAAFAARRRRGRADGRMPRLLVAEASPSLTGARADRRFALPPHDIDRLARALAAGFGVGPAAGHPLAGGIATELRRAGPAALVIVGRDQPPETHAVAHAINCALASRAVRHVEPVLPAAESVEALASALSAGTVRHLIVLGGNPAYDAPADLGLAASIARVPSSWRLGAHADETSRACRWHLPMRHPLESWGDTRARDGAVALVQPATTPLIEALSPIELVALLAGRAPDGRALVRERWAALDDARWRRALEDGVVADTAAPAVTPAIRTLDLAPLAPPPSGPVVTFAPDPVLWDGAGANNGWLQELPKPLTKLAWGNAALVAPATAAAIGLLNGDVVAIAVGGRSLRAPVWITPGQALDVFTLPLGAGRSAAGQVGTAVGFDAYRLRTASAPWAAAARVAATGDRERLVSTQAHHALVGDDIIRVIPAAALATPVTPPAPAASFYPDKPYDGHKWGMAIDLDACIGCNACVLACQAENNVAIVGADEVANGRAMHWLRVDRYHAGPADAPETLFQPVPCMHCEAAPCEVVCPVNATVHSSEGLNDMVYSRCVGTRTCSNNCPYKVRRFNWHDYQSEPGAAPAPTRNPRVTVRSGGVMEKCTYCVQRIRAGTGEAAREGRPLADGDVRTACQVSCPTDAIVFGDLNDPDSAVNRLTAEPRNYALLGALNTKPRTTYLARVDGD